MDYAYLGERTTPSKCGRMDQCCAFGSRPVSMLFDGDLVKCNELTVGKSLHIVIIDLKSSKDTKVILNDLNNCYKDIRNDNNETNKAVRNLFGSYNLGVTARAIKYIKNGNIQLLGELMNESQRLFDLHAMKVSPKELSAPKLHALLNNNKVKEYIYGGKGIGSQGDGSVQLLCKSLQDRDNLIQYITKELLLPCLSITIGGFQKIRKAIIPTASYGSNLFPSTKALSTALFPIIDYKDGLCKPAILILVEEALNAGIEEIYIIVSKHDINSFKSLFYEPIPMDQYYTLSPALQQYSQQIIQLGSHIKLIIQKDIDGLGHAIYQAKNYFKGQSNEPFLLMLGDHLYKSNLDNKSCVQQMIEIYLKNGKNLLGLKKTNENEISHYGTVKGEWIEYNLNNNNNI